MAEKACRTFAFTAQVGLTQVLDGGNQHTQGRRYMRVESNLRCVVLVVLLGAPLGARAQGLDTLRVPVDGHRMHLILGGQGSPTIVLEAGSGSTSRMWRTLQPALAAISRVVSYDRSGLGQSEPSKRPRTARVIAEELRDVLRGAQLPPPYLLVAHSAGGVYARVFASMYPTQVAGLVLVDPAAEDFYARAKREFPLVYARFDSLDAADIASRPPHERAEEDEWDTSLAQARGSDGIFTGPAIVLSSPRADLAELGPLWTDEHRRWAQRAPGREYVRVDSVGHAIHRDRPAVVLDAVRRILALSAEQRRK